MAPMGGQAKGVILAGLLALISTSAVAADPKPGQDLRKLPPFVLSFWCGPPPAFTSLSRYLEIRAAGFNVAMPPCAGTSVEQNLRILEAAQHAGIRVFLQDSRMPLRITGEKDAISHIDAIVKDYQHQPGFGGYFIADEPGAGAFPGLGEVVSVLRERDPDHPAFINLFPDYASADQLGVAAYEEYLRQYIGTVHPSFISYDHYHFVKGGDGPLFFQNLNAVRAASLQARLPFWNIVLLTTHGPYRNLTEGEIRWEAMQSLAYGAHGVLYFTYWTPTASDFVFQNGAIDQEGKQTTHYNMVRTANAMTVSLGSLLAKLTSERVYHSGRTPAGASAIPPDALLTPVTTPKSSQGPSASAEGVDSSVESSALAVDNYTLGEFRDRRGRRYVLLVNSDYRAPREVTLRIAAGVGKLEEYLPAQKRWRPRSAVNYMLTISVDAGGGVLFRLR